MSYQSIFFGTVDSVEIEQQVVAQYKALTGVQPNPGDPEFQMNATIAYMRVLALQDIERAGKANLVQYATGSNLDYLAFLIGLTRLPTSPSATTLQFILTPGHVQVVIPGGTQVSSQDGQGVYQTDEDATVPAFISAVCTMAILTVANAGDTLSSLSVNGTQLLSAPITFVADGTTATEIQIANAINAGGSGYTATGAGGIVSISAPSSLGSGVNGAIMSVGVITGALIVGSPTIFSGGVTGLNTINIDATCVVDGPQTNGYNLGTITTIQNPQPYIISASNITVSSGGSDAEADVSFRARWFTALEALSVAGPKGAYKFWALSANPTIIDVNPLGPEDGGVTPGTVELRILTNTGVPTQTILDQVYAACNPDTVRPLCDTVLVFGANQINYSLYVGIIAIEGAATIGLPGLVQAAMQAYITQQANKIGVSVIDDSLIAPCIPQNGVGIPGVKRLTLWQDSAMTMPFTDIIVDVRSFAVCNAFGVSVTGVEFL